MESNEIFAILVGALNAAVPVRGQTTSRRLSRKMFDPFWRKTAGEAVLP
jgi:hypothetical protein